MCRVQDSSRVTWLDFGNSSIHPGLDRSSRLAFKELYEAEACCKHADAILAQRRQKAARDRQPASSQLPRSR